MNKFLLSLLLIFLGNFVVTPQIQAKQVRSTFAGEWDSAWGMLTIEQNGTSLIGIYRAYPSFPQLTPPSQRFEAQVSGSDQAQGIIFYNSAVLHKSILQQGEINLRLSADGNYINGNITSSQSMNGSVATIDLSVQYRRCGPGLPACDPGNGMLTNTTSKVSKKPCPPPQEALEEGREEGKHYRTNAEDYERDAKGLRERATELRERAGEWLELSRSPRARGDTELFRQYEESARAMELQADRYDQQADEAESFAAEERRRYEERRHAGEESGVRSTSIRSDCVDADPRVAISEPPAPPSSISTHSTSPEKVCGPDVTEYVFQTLRKLYDREWKDANEDQRNAKCAEIINPLTAEDAWDINVFAPSRAMQSREDYLEDYPSGNYKNYSELQFWLEGISLSCAIPRIPCGPTVTFLGICAHSQIVNYVQWGFMNKLCDQEDVADFWHSARNAMANDTVHHGQQIMAGVGSIFAQRYDEFITELRSDDGRQMESFKNRSRHELELLMSNPEYRAFRSRAEAECSLTCTLTPEQEEKLQSESWTAEWGVGVSGNTQ